MNRFIRILSASAGAVLMAASAMLLNMPAARAVDSFFAHEASSNLFCQISKTPSNDVFKLPELGGSYLWPTSGRFTEGSTVGKARLTGVITGGEPVSTFDVDLVVEGRLNDGDVGYTDACLNFALRCGSEAGWYVYTSLSGTLTGLTGDFAGAVYSLSLRPGSCTSGFDINWGDPAACAPTVSGARACLGFAGTPPPST